MKTMSTPSRFAPVLLVLGLALAAMPAPSLAVGNPTGDDAFVFLDKGTVHVQARYYDGLGSTKFGFLMFQGSGGRAGDRLDPGAQCTEWHGTFTQVEVKAGQADSVLAAEYTLGGFLASAPVDAPASVSGRTFVFDALGSVGAFSGTLTVCDHPAGFGLVDFEGTLAPMPFAHTAAHPSIVLIQEAA